jgi:hypothetical protein
MRKLYEKKVRDESPVPRAIKKALPEMPDKLKAQQKKVETTLKAEAKKVRVRAMREVYNIYKQLQAAKQKNKPAESPSSSEQTAVVRVADRIIVGDPLEVEFETSVDHSDTDWIGVYPVDTPSVPGVSDGKWVYVPAGGNGIVRIPSSVISFIHSFHQPYTGFLMSSFLQLL